jgi:hypothetical protein
MRDLLLGTGDQLPRPDGGDDRLLEALRGALGAADAVPRRVTEGARMAFSLRDLPVLPASAPRWRPAARRRAR